MSGRVRRRPKAQEDIVSHAYHLAEKNVDASDRFIYGVEEAFRTLAAMPEMGAPRQFATPLLAGLRMWPVPGFRRYLIFYLPLTDGIEVVRVLHASRDLAALFEAET